SRSATTTVAPSRAKIRASLSPMPCAAPVTIATLPSSLMASPRVVGGSAGEAVNRRILRRRRCGVRYRNGAAATIARGDGAGNAPHADRSVVSRERRDPVTPARPFLPSAPRAHARRAVSPAPARVRAARFRPRPRGFAPAHRRGTRIALLPGHGKQGQDQSGERAGADGAARHRPDAGGRDRAPSEPARADRGPGGPGHGAGRWSARRLHAGARGLLAREPDRARGPRRIARRRGRNRRERPRRGSILLRRE